MFSRYPDGLLYPYECGQSNQEFVFRFREETKKLLQELKEQEGKLVIFPEFTAQEFFDALNSVWDPEPISRERLGLLRKLKGKGYGIYVLSNIGQSHFEYLRGDGEHGYHFSRFKELFEIIDGFIASCAPNIQCRKTRLSESTKEECEKIFKKALAIAESAPEQTVFVDDILDYVNVFRGMGGHGIHCTGNWTKVEAELYAFGIRW